MRSTGSARLGAIVSISSTDRLAGRRSCWRDSCKSCREKGGIVSRSRSRPRWHQRRRRRKRLQHNAPRPRRGAFRKQTLPTEHDIASRAYELFVQRGGEHGRDLDDWLLASASCAADLKGARMDTTTTLEDACDACTNADRVDRDAPSEADRPQAQRLWSLSTDVCDTAFETLVKSGFLGQAPDGAYIRHAFIRTGSSRGLRTG